MIVPYVGDDAALELLSELVCEDENRTREDENRTCPECGSDDIEPVRSHMAAFFECCTCGHDFDEDGETVDNPDRIVPRIAP